MSTDPLSKRAILAYRAWLRAQERVDAREARARRFRLEERAQQILRTSLDCEMDAATVRIGTLSGVEDVIHGQVSRDEVWLAVHPETTGWVETEGVVATVPAGTKVVAWALDSEDQRSVLGPADTIEQIGYLLAHWPEGHRWPHQPGEPPRVAWADPEVAPVDRVPSRPSVVEEPITPPAPAKRPEPGPVPDEVIAAVIDERVRPGRR